MKKLLCIILFVFIKQVNAQNPSYSQKLYYTCKVWGFIKYFHSGVSTCQVNWDSVLISRLPHIKNAATKANFNDELDTLINAAGPMTIVPGSYNDGLAPELKRNKNFTWINDTMLRTDVQVLLDTIKNNFRPHTECWVQSNNYTNSYTGWLVFPHDSLMINSNTNSTYPNEATRLLLAFKHWNIINYFNPYNYVLDKPWDTTLYTKILPIATATNDQNFYLAFKKICKDLDDAHTEGLTWAQYISPPTYYYAPEILLTYTQNKYVVTATNVSPITRGDIIVSVGGQSISTIENNFRTYISAGDSSVFHRSVAQYMLNGYSNTNASIVYTDSVGVNHSLNTVRGTYVYDNFFYSYYPNDTLASVNWKQLGCGVGYVNMGLLQTSDVNAMYSTLRTLPAIIFDLRNYPNGTAWAIATKLYPSQKNFAKLMLPSVTNPGTFTWSYDYTGANGNPTPYAGKIIILINEQTQSQAEYSCMIIGNMPNAIKVGSQTAGTDGNVTYFKLAQDIQTGFTNLGVFYPNGDSTQRIGIRPDTLVYPTPMGIRHHRDEVLEKALQIANCNYLDIPSILNPKNSLQIYPNPAKNNFTIETSTTEKQTLQIFDVNGKQVLMQIINGTTTIAVDNFSQGVYNVSLTSSTGIANKRLVIVK